MEQRFSVSGNWRITFAEEDGRLYRPLELGGLPLSGLLLSLMLLTPMGWADRLWALPFMSVLCPSQRYYTQRGRPAVSLLQRAQSMLLPTASK